MNILKYVFDTQMGPNEELPFQIRVDMGVMTMKGYPTFPKISITEASSLDAVLCLT